MKDLKQILKNKKVGNRVTLDEKSVFYVFQAVIKDEYGKQGIENFEPISYEDNMIFVKAGVGAWASEIWLKRTEIVKLINKQLGVDEIKDISMAN
jgi:hypothetical protein